MQATVYNKDAKEVGKIDLPEKVFGVKWNADLVHQVITSMQSNKRQGSAHTKTRGEVSGGGKKPWRQKGTGRARHGSIRSPLWRGGGTTFGPRSDKNYLRKISRKMKTKALYAILSAKLRDKEIIFVDSFGLSQPKTKEGLAVLHSLSHISGFEKLIYKSGKRALVATPAKDGALIKSLRNIKSTKVEETRNLNPLLLSTYKYVVITNPTESIQHIEGRQLAKLSQ